MKSYIPFSFPEPKTKLIIHRAPFTAKLQQADAAQHKKQKYDKTPAYIKTIDHHSFNASVSLLTPASIVQPIQPVIRSTVSVHPAQLILNAQLYIILCNKQYNCIATFTATQPHVKLSLQHHKLSIHVPRMLYQTLALVGTTDELLYSHKYKHTTYHVITIELNTLTDKQKSRAVLCLQKLTTVHMTLSVYDKQAQQYADINTLFVSGSEVLKFNTVSVQPSSNQYTNVLTPSTQLIETLCSIACKKYTDTATTESDVLRQLYDYVGALKLGMCSTDNVVVDINTRLMLPLAELLPAVHSSLQAGAMHEYSISGLIQTATVKQLVHAAQHYVQSQQLQYAVLYVQGCTDTVYSWNNQLHNVDLELAGSHADSGQNNHYCIVVLPNNHYIMYVDVINMDETH